MTHVSCSRRLHILASSHDHPSTTPSTPQPPRSTFRRSQVLNTSQRNKLNRYNDQEWYEFPRFVQHSDDGFRRSVTELYRQLLPNNDNNDTVILDLCSSWVSHLPQELKFKEVIGHGLNAQELIKNNQLDRFFVRNLNTDPDGWALSSNYVDAVLICCSVQYIQQPERVFAEIHRVLKPGGIVIVTFTNRLFYEKAIAAWRDASMYARAQLVKEYIMNTVAVSSSEDGQKTDGFTRLTTLTSPVLPPSTNVIDFFITKFLSQDPFYAVYAYKQS